MLNSPFTLFVAEPHLRSDYVIVNLVQKTQANCKVRRYSRLMTWTDEQAKYHITPLVSPNPVALNLYLG